MTETLANIRTKWDQVEEDVFLNHKVHKEEQKWDWFCSSVKCCDQTNESNHCRPSAGPVSISHWMWAAGGQGLRGAWPPPTEAIPEGDAG